MQKKNRIKLTAAAVILVLAAFMLNIDYLWLFGGFRIYGDIITKYSRAYDIDPLLSTALIREESRFFKGAVSSRGAIGLTQVMAPTAYEISDKLGMKINNYGDLFEPDNNVKIGLYYYSMLFKEFDFNIVYALAAYNAGMGNVKKFLSGGGNQDINDFPYRETKNFVKRVLKNYRRLQFANKIINMHSAF